MRSFLTMLGIIIGVLALVVLVSLVSGATSSVNDQISSIGTNLIQVSVMDDKGKPIKLDGASYTVVSVLQADDSDTSTTQTYEEYIPYTSLVRLTDSGSMEITSFYFIGNCVSIK